MGYTIKIEVKNLKEYLAHSIINKRRKMGINQAELARLIGMTPQNLCSIESCKTFIRIEDLEKVCKALKCKSSDLLPF